MGCISKQPDSNRLLSLGGSVKGMLWFNLKKLKKEILFTMLHLSCTGTAKDDE